MTNYKEANYLDKRLFTDLLANWLRPYTSEVINHVLKKVEEIYSNDTVMNMLKELKQREEKEIEDLDSSIYFAIESNEEKEFHLNCLTHSRSYRDVLYDMFIRDYKEEK